MQLLSLCWSLAWLCPAPGIVSAPERSPTQPAEYRVAETLAIDRVPSWFPVGFCLLTHGESQYAAYYDEEHRMIVARRRLGERSWQKAELPSKVGWDSHNYVTMAVDSEGSIHLAGNMHGVPLIYFRTRKPGDIATFEKLAMTGQEEHRCTYPRFLRTPDGELLFLYRSGGSGNGRRFCNRYDVGTRTWSRFLDTPLFDGEGERNAYPLGPSPGPDGFFHLVWVWRDTPDCATNHHLSHARSRDLRSWETAGGEPLRLPLTLDQTAAWVDPVPSGGGIINGCERLVFDWRDRPVIAYHKRDEKGRMQIYVARFEEGRWKRDAVTAWESEIPFGGGGAMPFIGIRLGDVRRLDEGEGGNEGGGGIIAIGYRHRDHGSGRIVLDEETLRPLERDLDGDVVIPAEIPSQLLRPIIAFEGIRVKLAHDAGEPPDAGARYVLRWETLEANHDRPREPPLPPASVLELVELERIR